MNYRPGKKTETAEVGHGLLRYPHMPGWILPVGLILSGILVKGVTIKRATA